MIYNQNKYLIYFKLLETFGNRIWGEILKFEIKSHHYDYFCVCIYIYIYVNIKIIYSNNRDNLIKQITYSIIFTSSSI